MFVIGRRGSGFRRWSVEVKTYSGASGHFFARSWSTSDRSPLTVSSLKHRAPFVAFLAV